MKKLLMVIMTLVMLTAVIRMTAITASAAATNLMPSTAGTFESTDIPAGWTFISGGTLAISADESYRGQKALSMTARTQTYHSPAYSLTQIVKANGAGTYNISMWVYAEGLSADGSALLRIRNGQQGFSFLEAGKTYATLGTTVSIKNGKWTQLSGTLTVTAADISMATSNDLLVCTDAIAASATLYIDDVSVDNGPASTTATPTKGTTATTAPGATQKPSSNTEKTGDMSTLGYALSTMLGLGGITLIKRRVKK